MTGPDAATCIMVAAILGPLAGGDPARYQSLMVVLTLCTGLIYVVAGFARLGFIANFLSLPILTGYLNGIALIIVVGQLPKLLGYASESGDFLPKVAEFAGSLGDIHAPTAALGLGLLAVLVLLRRLTPRLPNPLIVVIAGILLVHLLGLDAFGVAVLGTVPAGLPPAFQLPGLDMEAAKSILRDATGLVLVSFTSGILTAKSFAQRNRYDIDANQELIGFGAANLASGVAQSFPVTGADSRTAINNAMGGKSQLVGIVAGAAMLLILFFLTDPLADVPTAALAAVIVVSAAGLADIGTLRDLYGINRVEFFFSVGTTIGVLVLGVLPGVMLAVVLSLVMLLAVTSRPKDEVLGRVPGMRGFHSVADYPEAKTLPGLLLYRFDADVLFYNVDYFKDRLLTAIDSAEHPVEWVVVDLSPVNIVDVTALTKFDALKADLAERGIVIGIASAKLGLERFFRKNWFMARKELTAAHQFPTLKAAIHAFEKRDQHAKAPGGDAGPGSGP
jgi:high affinity sulfate transporter 1